MMFQELGVVVRIQYCLNFILYPETYGFQDEERIAEDVIHPGLSQW